MGETAASGGVSVKRNGSLMRDVADCQVPEGCCAFWWLGQHSFLLKLGRTVLALDPFITDLRGRRVPPLLAPEDFAGVDFVLGSHDHADHIDRPAWPRIAAAAPGVRFVAPALVADRLPAELGIEPSRIRGLDAGETCEAGPVRVTGIAAAHEFLDRDSATGRYPYLGFVVRGHGCAVYHSGDTCVYEGLQPAVAAHRPDVAFLPINGRDARRLRANCIGNMTYQEAADLAGAVRPVLTVPGHFDMFAGNTEDPALFVDYMAVKYPDLRTLVPEHGVRVSVCGRAHGATGAEERA